MKPRNIFIVRHGQSQGNADPSMYLKIPDHAIELTDKGVKQAYDAGQELFNSVVPTRQYARHFGSPTWAVYYSPFVRSIQTTENIIRGYNNMCEKSVTRISKSVSILREEPRIREQEWHARMPGEDINKKDIEGVSKRYSKFYYRFESGESCADVYDRVSDFMNTLHRDFEKESYPENVLLVSHGLAMRVFLMRWFHKTVAEFDTWGNPRNGEIWKLSLNSVKKYDFDWSTLRIEPPVHSFSRTLKI